MASEAPKFEAVAPLDELTYVGQSAIEGLGIFAKVDLPKGTCWWTLKLNKNVLLITYDQYKQLMDSNQEGSPLSQALLASVNHFGYYEGNQDAIAICMDNARFTNHSDDPNSGGDPTNPISVALRDIKAGEEITEDYMGYHQCPWPEPYRWCPRHTS
eukprot:TRINITY_DN1273_c0_g1_i1.p1 TRINITY_DN1273_c0_g1~~TRINITY_DN1273_c0_g1_i1.p1  ORF type:complete len:157 (-),score=34.90 TRINITY_DN1273_c0_g1_i1:315-785(-)